MRRREPSKIAALPWQSILRPPWYERPVVYTCLILGTCAAIFFLFGWAVHAFTLAWRGCP